LNKRKTVLIQKSSGNDVFVLYQGKMNRDDRSFMKEEF